MGQRKRQPLAMHQESSRSLLLLDNQLLLVGPQWPETFACLKRLARSPSGLKPPVTTIAAAVEAGEIRNAARQEAKSVSRTLWARPGAT